MHSSTTIKGSCFCASVTYTLSAPPVLRAYCHCTNCQRLTGEYHILSYDFCFCLPFDSYLILGCPFVHTIHFEASAFSWTHSDPDSAESHLDKYTISNKPHKIRYRCKTCGATVASHNTIKNRWSVWGAQLERPGPEGRIKDWDLVKPTAHIFYGTRMLDVNDSLSKWDGYEGLSNAIP